MLRRLVYSEHGEHVHVEEQKMTPKTEHRFLLKGDHLEAIALIAHVQNLLQFIDDGKEEGIDNVIFETAMEELEEAHEILLRAILIDAHLIAECEQYIKERFDIGVQFQLVSEAPKTNPVGPNLKIMEKDTE